MEFEDSRNALFCDPNAYIQKYQERDKCETKKVVFQEPYECMPSYHMDNNFKKHDCSCVGKGNKPCKHGVEDCNLKTQNGFDFKSLLPLVSLFNKDKSMDFSSIMNMFQKQNVEQSPMNLISTLLGNSDAVSNILSLFKVRVPKKIEKELKTTDFEIKNYTRVD